MGASEMTIQAVEPNQNTLSAVFWLVVTTNCATASGPRRGAVSGLVVAQVLFATSLDLYGKMAHIIDEIFHAAANHSNRTPGSPHHT